MMDHLHEIIELSDDDEDYSGGFMFDLEEAMMANVVEFGPNAASTETGQHGEAGPSRTQNLSDTYESCLREILEIFPDISRDHVQQMYNSDIGTVIPHQRQGGMAASRLIEKILDGGAYPKERDRMRELKRKRSDKDVDEEEAAKWKYMHLRDDPAEYAKVAYVNTLLSCIL